jgi:hypothetical protein
VVSCSIRRCVQLQSGEERAITPRRAAEVATRSSLAERGRRIDQMVPRRAQVKNRIWLSQASTRLGVRSYRLIGVQAVFVKQLLLS